MPPSTLLMPGSLNGEPGLAEECPGVFGSRSWQDWLGRPVPGGLAADAGPTNRHATATATGMAAKTVRRMRTALPLEVTLPCRAGRTTRMFPHLHGRQASAVH